MPAIPSFVSTPRNPHGRVGGAAFCRANNIGATTGNVILDCEVNPFMVEGINGFLRIHASICFSTVLPAVLSTNEFLGTFPRLVNAFADWHPVTFSGKRKIGRLLLVGAGLSLGGLSVFPDHLFPLVWISHLLVIVGIQLVSQRPTIFAEAEKMATGNISFCLPWLP